MVDTIFRAAHTIKGSSGFIGLTGISDFTHSIETVLDLIRKGEIIPDRELITVLLEAADLIKEMIGHVASDTVFNYACGNDIVERMDRLRTRMTRKDFKIIFLPGDELFGQGLDPAVIMEELKALGELFTVKTYTDSAPSFT